MKTPQIVGCFSLIPVFFCAVLSAADSDDQKVTELIRALPQHVSRGPADSKLVESIVAQGDRALPALEKELRLGIKFPELNQLLKDEQSRRGAVAYVLGQLSSEGSTALLVASLADPPDNYGMRMGTLQNLADRKLTVDQIRGMLKNNEPEVVLAGIAHAVQTKDAPQIAEDLARVFDRDQARDQFHNEYGSPTASDDIFWDVRLAAGRALGKDMVPEMRTRASDLITVLKTEATEPSSPDKAEFMSYASKTENQISSAIQKLATLGEPVKMLVENEAVGAQGHYAKILAMALVRLGDRSKVAQVTDDLVSSDSHTIRFCAAITLRISKDRSALPALKKALHDPYQRQDGSCCQVGDGMIYPVRIVVADALIDLGVDPKVVRKEQLQK